MAVVGQIIREEVIRLNEKQKGLLSKMAEHLDQTGRNQVDGMFYLGVPDYMLDEMESRGYIKKFNDILGTIELTNDGYKLGKG